MKVLQVEPGYPFILVNIESCPIPPYILFS